jgi:hypothetical protein
MEGQLMGDQNSSLGPLLPYLWWFLIAGLLVWQAWLGVTVQELGIPGVATVKFGKSAPTPPRDEFDLRLVQTDADIIWSNEVRREIQAIIPSRLNRIHLLESVKPKLVRIQVPDNYSNRQRTALYNAAQETFEIGIKGTSRRYEIAPMDDGGADLHYAEMTVNTDYTSGPQARPCRGIDVRFVQPGTGHTYGRMSIAGCRNDEFRIWTSD